MDDNDTVLVLVVVLCRSIGCLKQFKRGTGQQGFVVSQFSFRGLAPVDEHIFCCAFEVAGRRLTFMGKTNDSSILVLDGMDGERCCVHTLHCRKNILCHFVDGGYIGGF